MEVLVPRHDVYELSTTELVGEYVEACIAATAENSGPAATPLGAWYTEQRQHLVGVIISRLRGYVPPFNRGDVVQTGAQAGERVNSIVTGGEIPVIVKVGHGYQVERIWYEGEGAWSLEFRSPKGSRFPAEHFVKVEKVAQGNPWSRRARAAKGVA